jgi:hypothetical protein
MKPLFKDPEPNLVRFGGPQDAAPFREDKFIQRMLEDRDRQFASFQRELLAMRRDWAWRTLGLPRHAFSRVRRQFWRTASAEAAERRDFSPPGGWGTAA